MTPDAPAAPDLSRAEAVLAFGAEAQRDLQLLSQGLTALLQGEAAPAGATLREMAEALRDPGERPDRSWLGRLLGRPASPGAMDLAGTQARVDRLAEALHAQEAVLRDGVRRLAALRAKAATHLARLEACLAAGEARLGEAEPGAGRDLLDRRLHDLRLTRQVALQALACLDLVQEADAALAGQVRSLLATALPLWEVEVGQALARERVAEAAERARAAAGQLAEALGSGLAAAEGSRARRSEAAAELGRGAQGG